MNKCNELLIDNVFTIFIVIIAIFLNSCSDELGMTSAQKARANQNNLEASTFPDSSLYVIGGTYDDTTTMPTSNKTCAVLGNNLDNIQLINPHASLDFSQSQDSSSIQSALGVDFKAQYNMGFTKLKVSYGYGKSTQDDEYTLNINYAYKYSATATFNDASLVQGYDALIPDAKKILVNNPSSDAKDAAYQFRKMCGSGMITQMDAGVSLLTRLTLKFKSHSEKNAYDDKFDDIEGMSGVLQRILSNKSGINYQLTAAGLQLGGNPQAFNNLLLKNGGVINKDGYPEINCTSGNQCVNLVNQIMDYATSLKVQLKSKSDYYYSNPVIAKWQEIGINPENISIDPQVLQTLDKLSEFYTQDNDAQKFTNDYIDFLEQESTFSKDLYYPLVSLNNIYDDIMFRYSKLDKCYVGFADKDCLPQAQAFFEAREELLSEHADLINLLSYLYHNRYTADLLINNTQHLACDLLPITDLQRHLFLIDCEGQVSKGSDAMEFSIVKLNDKELQLSNLNYQYQNESSMLNTIDYNLSGNLISSNTFKNRYVGKANVNVDGEVITEKLQLVNFE